MNDFLAGILYSINSVVQNYGWSIVVFTILIKLVLFPLDFKSRKSMRKMQAVQPEVAKLQKKYANDKDKLNQKTMELYKREKVSPMAGCVPMLLSMPVLFAMFAAMRSIANAELAKQVIGFITTGEQVNESWLWVKNLWMPDSPFAAVIADQNSLQQIPQDIWQKVIESLAAADPNKIEILNGLGITLDSISADTYKTIYAVFEQTEAYKLAMLDWTVMPKLNLLITQLKIFANPNGWLILPILDSRKS